MHDDTASRFTLSASRHSNYECELSLNWSCERLRVYCQTCARFVVVRRHRTVTRIACRLQSAPNGCGTPPLASLDRHGAIAMLQVDGAVRLAVVRIAIATYAALRGHHRNATRGAAQHLPSPVLLRDQRARTCKSHLVRSRNLGTCHVQRALGVGGVMLSAAGSQCTCCNKKIGLRLRWMQRAVCNRWWISSVTRGRTGRMAKKTVAAATAATTAIGRTARLTWSRGGRTCSGSTSAACRCRPCRVAR